MDNEAKKQMVELGMNAALIYQGALKELHNTKQAERIVFLFFISIIHGRDDSIQLLLNGLDL